jgi:hypothetical protein
MELLRKKNGNMETIYRGMQAQGRGQVNVNDLDTYDEDGTESDYAYEDGGRDKVSRDDD